MKYEVVIAIYEKGQEDSLSEETVFETDDLAEAQEEFDDLIADAEEDGAEEEEVEEEEVG